MKKNILIASFIILGCLIMMVGCNEETDENSDKNEEAVLTDLSHTALTDRIESFGYVTSASKKSVVLEFEALVIDVPVSEGEQVSAGDPLVSLKLDSVNAELDRKRFNLNMEEVHLENIKRVLIPHADSCNDCLTVLSRGYDRLQKKSDIALKEQQIALINREIRLLREQLSRLPMENNYIMADIENALVYKVSCDPGDYIAPGEPLMVLIDLDSLIIQAEVPEEFIRDVEVGATAYITPIADPSREYTGEVKQISNMATLKGGETIVLVDIAMVDHDGFLKLNYNVDVSIER